MERSQSISSFAKVYLLVNVLFALLVYSKALDPYAISYTFTQSFFEIALWRPITAIFYLGRVGLLLPFQLAFAYLAVQKISNKVYKQGTTADMVWLLILSIFTLSIFSTFVSLYFYGNSFVMIMLMMWAMQYSTDSIKFGSLSIHSVYFPIIYPAIMIALGSSYKNYMAGFLLGLIFGVIKSQTFIQEYGDIFPTPNFIQSFFRQNVYENERRVEDQREGQRGGHFQGQGYRLG